MHIRMTRLKDATLADFINQLQSEERYGKATYLNLSLNGLYYVETAVLASMFRNIPDRVTVLDLSANSLGLKSAADWVELFGALPLNIRTLILSENLFGYQSTAWIQVVFRAIPQQITAIQLGRNDLYLKTTEELIAIFQAIPGHVTSVDLSSMKIDSRSADRLSLILAALPTTVRALNLSNNNLHNRIATLVIPALITELNLSGNALHNLSSAQFAQIFARFPEGLRSLDLSNNNLGNKTDEELSAILASVPVSVTSLNLKGNNLDSTDKDRLRAIFKSLPSSVTTLILDNNIANALPEHIKVFVVNDKVFNLEEKKFFARRKEKKEQCVKSLEAQLRIIKDKVTDLIHTNVHGVAQTFYKKLDGSISQYKKGAINFVQLQTQTKDAVLEARPQLAHHRGWKQVFANIGLCFLGLGVFYLVACAMNRGFFKYDTDSITKLKDLNRTFDTLKGDEISLEGRFMMRQGSPSWFD